MAWGGTRHAIVKTASDDRSGMNTPSLEPTHDHQWRTRRDHRECEICGRCQPLPPADDARNLPEWSE